MHASGGVRRVLSRGLAVAALLFAAMPARADFVGTLQLVPAGCETSGECRLGADFGFVDAAGLGWQAAKGLVTDGASIPPWAKPFIGQSFEPAFIRAAVIHDHYCVRQVRPWRQTHKVFYEALRASGVSQSLAGIMYYAVMIGGPKWVKLVQGRPCPVGMSCLNAIEMSEQIRASILSVRPEIGVTVRRPAEYGSQRFEGLMQQGVPALLAKGNELTRADVEQLAAKLMVEDFYFKNGDEVGTTSKPKFELE